ncbi:hypothetical protein IGB42_01901 [Andreprevotia sp. IGB-42]|uniref:hypothetical protein n=1 Tax=Andreprevotia sp. IGB-42 TaxID=2497473 RepID=UPI00135718D5|nr:hypothetical protein [Andreprevotia sp. IGB-42]KAF0813550.1 hypothetical protein IGB42_01901 [Andreprevotia sp. IGB-42]
MTQITLSNATRFPAQFVVAHGGLIIARLPALAPGAQMVVPVSDSYEITALTQRDEKPYTSAPQVFSTPTHFLAQMQQNALDGGYDFQLLSSPATEPEQLQFESTTLNPVYFAIRKDDIKLQTVVVTDSFHQTTIALGDTYSIYAIIDGITTAPVTTTVRSDAAAVTVTATVDDSIQPGYYRLTTDQPTQPPTVPTPSPESGSSQITLRNKTAYPSQFVVNKGEQVVARLPPLAPDAQASIPTGNVYEVVASTVIDGNTYTSAPLDVTGAMGFLAQVVQVAAQGTYEFVVTEVPSRSPDTLTFQKTCIGPVTFTVIKNCQPLQQVVVHDSYLDQTLDIGGDTYSIYAVINGVTTDPVVTQNPAAIVTAQPDDSSLEQGYFTLSID